MLLLMSGIVSSKPENASKWSPTWQPKPGQAADLEPGQALLLRVTAQELPGDHLQCDLLHGSGRRGRTDKSPPAGEAARTVPACWNPAKGSLFPKKPARTREE